MFAHIIYISFVLAKDSGWSKFEFGYQLGALAFLFLPATPAGTLAAPVLFVDGSPGASFRFLFRHSTLLIALGNVLGFPLLLLRVFRLLALWHHSDSFTHKRQRQRVSLVAYLALRMALTASDQGAARAFSFVLIAYCFPIVLERQQLQGT
jgi:hypothetical protein